MKLSIKQRDNHTTRAYETLRTLIIEKKLPGGSKINQGKLAQRLKISPTPLINALHKLSSEGLVDSIPQRGFFVHRLTVKELLDLISLREAMDSIILPELVSTITDEKVSELERLFEPFIDDSAMIDRGVYWGADRKFHDLLWKYSQNDIAKNINDRFQILNRAYRGGLLRGPQETLPEHRAIIQALKNRDAVNARKAAVEHIAKTKRVLQNIINKLNTIGLDPNKLHLDELQGEFD